MTTIEQSPAAVSDPTVADAGRTPYPGVVLVAEAGRTMIVTGAAALLPGLGVTTPAQLGHEEPGEAYAFDARDFLGRKGIRYKDRATLLATAAVELALAESAEGTGQANQTQAEGTAVVVASCYGNLDTVCRVAADIDSGGVKSISPMDLPNASSNVVAANIAIRHGFQGVCLSVCNGHDGGWAAVVWAGRLIASRRAARVVVVGVETPSPPETQLRGPGGAPLIDGAAALVLGAPAPGDIGDPNPERPVLPTGRPPLLADFETASFGGVADVVRGVALVRSRPGVTCELTRPGGSEHWSIRSDVS